MSNLLSYINNYISDFEKKTELEIRFNDKLKKKEFENVYNVLLNYGFEIKEENHSLRCLLPERMRVQIDGLDNIRSFCLTDIIPLNSTYMKKEKIKELKDKNYMFNIVTSNEIIIDKHQKNIKNILYNWDKLRKSYRLMNRISLIHKDLIGFQIDFSIVKFSNNLKDIFNIKEGYEIELEITSRDIEDIIIEKNVKKGIKYILMGLQNTSFPITKLNIETIKDEYKKLFASKNNVFIGPNSVTLQQQNLIENENTNIPNISSNFCVTDKADGERHLLYIGNDNNIYLITNKVDIIYTGIKIQDEYNSLKGVLIDGEFIRRDKHNNIINLYAAFDIYFITLENLSIDIRKKEFQNNRYKTLKKVMNKINEKIVNPYNTNITFEVKKFYFTGAKNTIYNNCKILFNYEKSSIYHTDGLIFTHQTLGVGMENDKDDIKNKKYTWRNSFKWKPPEQNTIDFKIKIINENDINISKNDKINIYKKVELYVIYNKTDIEPQYQLLNNIKIDSNQSEEDKFIPSNPYDKDAYIGYFLKDVNGNLLTLENEIIDNNHIVECKYIITDDKRLRWIPLRIRFDKINPNGFNVANSNWFSIHNPVTKKMLTNKDKIINIIDIDEDSNYYNKNNVCKSENMRKFHNKNIKSLLYNIVSKDNDSLIDYAVGKGGDIQKYLFNKLKFVLGIDLSKDNINNKKDGACARYLNIRKKLNFDTKYLFIEGNTGKTISNGSFSDNEISTDIIKILLGKEDIRKYNYLNKEYAMFNKGFDIGSIQFALHYMFKDIDTLHNFARNCCDTIKLNGYFIGTCYDGNKVFDLLDKETLNEKQLYELRIDDVKLWHIQKKYENTYFNDDETSLGYKITVYQDSINNEIDEYLVNFNYFKQIMNKSIIICLFLFAFITFFIPQRVIIIITG